MGETPDSDRYLEVAKRLELADAEFDIALKQFSKTADAAEAAGFRDLTEMHVRTMQLETAQRRLQEAKAELQLITGGPEPVELTPRVLEVVRESFATEHQAEVIRGLESEVARNLPFCEQSTAQDLEELRLAVLKLAGGDLVELRRQIETAKFDARDVIDAAE